MLYEIGVEGVPMFRNAKPDHISMEEKYVDMELKSVREIDELAKAKSDAAMKQIKALNTSLNKIAYCCYYAQEAMIASPVLEACVIASPVLEACVMHSNALRTLEAMLHEIGVEGVPMFRNAKPDHISMEEKYVDMKLKSVREIDELAKAKSDAVMKQIKALNTSLNKIAYCCDAKEAMIASPVLEACVRYSDVVALLDDLEAHMASIKIAMDSSILATVCTFDVLRVLEKSCHMAPRHVLIEEADIKDEKC
jgi:hypothetical protein